MKKTLIFFFAILLSVYAHTCAYARPPFYHGTGSRRGTAVWHEKSTEHFVIYYREKYFDPEPVLQGLLDKVGLQPVISGIKIRLFIEDGQAYTAVGTKSIHAADARTLTHELTHLLFLQLNRNAPRSISEGIALYMESGGKIKPRKVEVKEIIEAEMNFLTSPAKYNKYGQLPVQDTDAELYSKGLYFVNGIIKDKGMEVFKEFYRNCHSVEGLQKAWEGLNRK